MIDVADIVNGIREEIRATPKRVSFRVESKMRDGAVWKVFISTDDKGRNELDESLEGATVWWKGPPNGVAEILSVVPDESQINLRFASIDPPAAGNVIVVNLPQYLEKLEECWSDDDWAETCIRWLERVENGNPLGNRSNLSTHEFPWLRKAQKEAFSLPSRTVSFLHGPPGTGKTRTLGALIGQYLLTYPQHRVLLLSTTNVAVDEAIVSADKALAEMASSRARKLRREQCKRLGNHFVASKYRDREHLLPKQDTNLLEQLIRLEAERPKEENASAYAAWKSKVEAIRAKMKANATGVLRESRLVAITTTRAVYTFEALREHFTADLIVFDEASQVGLAHALALAPLGQRAIFTGDPQQLAPICRSSVDDSINWLGTSMFSRQTRFSGATFFLDEQSRMTESVCQVVSKTFYGSRLKVAKDCDRTWRKERDVSKSRVERNPVSICRIAQGGTYSQKYGGYIRYESAQFIADMISNLDTTGELNRCEVLVLTPFRAQRRLIKALLKRSGNRGIRVSTVHKAQGSECHTIIFDPVDGDNKFLKTEDAKRLVNVALSRTKARLVILLSENDVKNPIFARVQNVVQSMSGIMQSDGIYRNKGRRDRSISLILDPKFPHCAIEKEISISGKSRDIVGRVKSVSEDGSEFHLFDYETGELKKFRTEYVKKNAAAV